MVASGCYLPTSGQTTLLLGTQSLDGKGQGSARVSRQMRSLGGTRGRNWTLGKAKRSGYPNCRDQKHHALVFLTDAAHIERTANTNTVRKAIVLCDYWSSLPPNQFDTRSVHKHKSKPCMPAASSSRMECDEKED